MTTVRRDTRALRRSWRPWLPLFVVLVLAFGVGSFGSRPAATNEDRLFEIARSMQCPVCQGESVAESNVAISQNIRTEIAKRVKAGQSDDEIRAYLGQTYPEFQLTPQRDGVVGLVWAIPVIALVIATAGLVVTFRRWSEPLDHHATAADQAIVRRALATRADHPDNPAGPDPDGVLS